MALIRRLPVWGALFVGGLLFAVSHFDCRCADSAGAGRGLGWVVWRTGSIFPAMLLHGFYDGMQLAYSAYMLLHGDSPDTSVAINPLAQPGDRMLFGLGVVLLVGGWMLIRRHPATQHLGPMIPLTAMGGVDITSKTSI